VSSLVQRVYGIDGICLSVPAIVGRKGIESQTEIKLWPKEQMALQQSARALKETLGKVRA
jgi:L-lactate dehydrogenase